jgi:hypothetical protein
MADLWFEGVVRLRLRMRWSPDRDVRLRHTEGEDGDVRKNTEAEERESEENRTEEK